MYVLSSLANYPYLLGTEMAFQYKQQNLLPVAS
jgi:hypothetical protein